MQKGWLVYVEAAYELREADSTADPDSPAAHRQIFLRHGRSAPIPAVTYAHRRHRINPCSEEDGEQRGIF